MDFGACLPTAHLRPFVGSLEHKITCIPWNWAMSLRFWGEILYQTAVVVWTFLPVSPQTSPRPSGRTRRSSSDEFLLRGVFAQRLTDFRRWRQQWWFRLRPLCPVLWITLRATKTLMTELKIIFQCLPHRQFIVVQATLFKINDKIEQAILHSNGFQFFEWYNVIRLHYFSAHKKVCFFLSEPVNLGNMKPGTNIYQGNDIHTVEPTLGGLSSVTFQQSNFLIYV